MDKIEMAKAYSSGFDPQYREVAYDAFLCGYDAKCDAPFSEEPICLDDGGAPNSQKCGDCTIACEAKVEEDRDVVFWKGMRYAYEQMKSEAVEGEVTERKFGGSIPETFAVTTEHFESSTLKKGDKVKVFIFEKE